MPIKLELFNIIHETYLKCFQLLASPPYHRNLGDPKSFGSGFVLMYHGRYYFITADHVVSPDNETDFVQWGNDWICGILIGKNDEENHASLCLPLTGRIEFVKGDINPKDNLAFPEPIDLAFSLVDERILDCRSLGFFIHSSIFRFSAGENKRWFKEDDIVKPEEYKNSNYFIIGSIIRINENNQQPSIHHKLHYNLIFKDVDGENIVLENPSIIDRKKDWDGLSGSPVVNEEGKLLGMLIKAADGYNNVIVMPIETIIFKINQIERLRQIGHNINDPFIIVGPGVTMDMVKNSAVVKEIISKIKK